MPMRCCAQFRVSFLFSIYRERPCILIKIDQKVLAEAGPERYAFRTSFGLCDLAFKVEQF